MKVPRQFRFVDDPKQNEILRKIVGLCGWVESSDGRHALLCSAAGDCGDYAHMAQSTLEELQHLFQSLFDGWPEADFVVDLTRLRCPVDAYCEAMSAIRRIEETRGLPDGALEARVYIPTDGESSLEEMKASERWSQMKLLKAIEAKKVSEPPLNPLFSLEVLEVLGV